ncbi:MAG: N-acetylmuramoyl-L-alanine amidase [Eggerthellaceae bacterium]|nr:N-acetylmuramoyl-L-alanine amidase [Eggerthellaceae bacterium]
MNMGERKRIKISVGRSCVLANGILVMLLLVGCGQVPGIDEAAVAQLSVAGLVPESTVVMRPLVDVWTDPAQIHARVGIRENLQESLDHGEKPRDAQRYIVLHDTEGDGAPEEVVSYWLLQGKGVGAHFVIGRDGEVVQCVGLDRIAHHAGFGDAGNNVRYGVNDESRDDRRGTEPIGSFAPDYGMNSYSIGIELVHRGASNEEYPARQLAALDRLIAFLDAYYGRECAIIDHKMWRSSNSDTSSEFNHYLRSYQTNRRHS